jgi:hypothetical protein
MGDVGDDFKIMREAGKLKRASNRELSADYLKAYGISFESKNNGAHLIVMNKIDFWPGTGRWIVRATKKRGFGVKNLVKRLK